MKFGNDYLILVVHFDRSNKQQINKKRFIINVPSHYLMMHFTMSTMSQDAKMEMMEIGRLDSTTA